MNSASKAKNKYNKKNYDAIYLQVPKGTKSIWQTEARKNGMSLATFLDFIVNTYKKNKNNA